MKNVQRQRTNKLRGKGEGKVTSEEAEGTILRQRRSVNRVCFEPRRDNKIFPAENKYTGDGPLDTISHNAMQIRNLLLGVNAFKRERSKG